jgi:hypothetical protein
MNALQHSSYYLVSNAKTSTSIPNTLTKFNNAIPTGSFLNEGSFCVALESIQMSFNAEHNQMPQSITSDDVHFGIIVGGGYPPIPMSIPQTSLTSIKNCYEYLDRFFKFTLQKAFQAAGNFKISHSLNEKTGHTMLRFERLGLLMHKSFYHWMGYNLQSALDLSDHIVSFKRSWNKIQIDPNGHYYLFPPSSHLTLNLARKTPKGNLSSLAQLPKRVQVKLEELSPILSNRGNEKILFTSAVESFRQQNTTAFLDLSNFVYHPLSHHELRSFNITLLDQNGEQIALPTGHPTIIHLKIQKMLNENMFTSVSLSSYDGEKKFLQNTNSHFHADLPRTLNFEESGWKAVLSSIHLPSNVSIANKWQDRTLLNIEIKVRKHETNEFDLYYVFFDHLTNETVWGLIEHIKGSLAQLPDRVPQLTLELSTDNVLSMLLPETIPEANVEYKFTPTLAYALGWISSEENIGLTIQEKQTITCHDKVDLSRLMPSSLFVYCNAVLPSVVGGTYAQLLKVLHLEKGKNSYFCNNHEPVALSRHTISCLEFHLKDHSGKDIEFIDNTGDVLINMYFTRNE